MRYEDSPKISADYLRQALPLMTKLGLSVNPINYAVCYEYVAGSNFTLRREMEQAVKGRKQLSNEDTELFYDKFIARFDQRKIEHMQEETRRVLQELLDTITSVNTSTEKYGESLEQYGTRLEDKIELFELQQLIQSLLADTQYMQKSYGRLKRKLEASTKEVVLLRKKLQSAQKEAETDPLTGLLNRKGFKLAMKRAFKEIALSNEPIWLLLLDIDHFKDVNDTYGHAFGDAVLKAVATTLQRSVKGQDTVARFGGEEFTIILPNTPRKGAQQVAENIRLTIEKGKIARHGSNEPVGHITISIGVAEFRAGESIEELIERTDAALYQSKNNGRNRVTVC